MSGPLSTVLYWFQCWRRSGKGSKRGLLAYLVVVVVVVVVVVMVVVMMVAMLFMTMIALETLAVMTMVYTDDVDIADDADTWDGSALSPKMT